MKWFLMTLFLLWASLANSQWSPQAETVTLPLTSFVSLSNTVGVNVINITYNGRGASQAQFYIPISGWYSFSIPAAIWMSSGSGYLPFTVFLDSAPIDHGPDPLTLSNFVFGVPYAPACTSLCPYTNYTASGIYLSAGDHNIQVQCLECGSIGLLTAVPVLTLNVASPPPFEPAGNRDPTIQPFRSYSMWNAALGSRATWSLPTDADTQMLVALGGFINSGFFSEPVYVGQLTDPLISVTPFYNGLPTLFAPFKMNFNATHTVAPGGDNNIVAYSADHSIILDGLNCSITMSPFGIVCSPVDEISVCAADNVVGTGVHGAGAPGILRLSERLFQGW